jgi:asparagine synthase (glutamine-hydrolysing)
MEGRLAMGAWPARHAIWKSIEHKQRKEGSVCGICGKLNFERGADVSPALLKTMADTIEHRGPDDEGYYVDGQVGFGFRRLSIIDLNTGHQPISNENGTVWIVFNGEIYNYKELRQQLQSRGHIFRTQTDTEVIVHLYEEYGEACVEHLRGMFGFAIWDQNVRTLFLARDRVGIKPLYYWLSESSLVFGSEIKAILADPAVKRDVNTEMVDRFLTFYYMPGEETLLQGIRKLAPGHSLLVKDGKVRIRKYWDLEFVPAPHPVKEVEEKLLSLLDEAVRMHMIADVPVGFLLSGGVDSTAMLSFAVGKTDHELSSFTLGFSSSGIADERPFATMAAKRYGSRHHEMTITSKEFADFLPKLAWHMEEPVCEPQAVALYYVSRLAKDFVKVLISGEGGDEAFAGYQTYRGVLWLERLKNALGPLNNPVSSMLTTANQLLKFKRIRKYAPLLSLPFEDYYFSRTTSPFSYFNQHSASLYTKDFAHHIHKRRSIAAVSPYLEKTVGGGVVNKMLYIDTKTSLPDDLLLKADKMTMANSIELRVPMLDHKFLEFAATVPESLKVHAFTTKYVLKTALRNHVPKEILDRRKAGFPVPYESWLRTTMKSWVVDTLLDRTTVDRGYFKRNAVEKLIHAHVETGRYPKEILSLVSLELWHRAFLAGETSPMQVPELVSK